MQKNENITNDLNKKNGRVSSNEESLSYNDLVTKKLKINLEGQVTSLSNLCIP
jgi:hypothetical protein